MPNGTKSPMIASAAADIVEQLGQPHPQRRVARARGPGNSGTARASASRDVEPVADRALVAVHQRARRAVVGPRHVGPDRPLTFERRSGRCPSAPSTVRISVSPTCAMHARLADLMAAHDLEHVELEDRRRAREREELRGRPDARPAGHLAPSPRSHAPRPQPPNSAPVPEVSPGTTCICHRFGSAVRSRPKNSGIHRQGTLPGGIASSCTLDRDSVAAALGACVRRGRRAS